MDYKPFVLPEALTKPYHGEAYVSREPFLMNELVDDKAVINKLRDKKINENQVFIGVAGFRSLDLLSITGRDQDQDKRYRQALLFDNNEQQVRAMNNILIMIEDCDTPEAFKKQFTERYLKWVDHVPQRRYSGEIMENMGANPNHPLHHRLTEDKNYFGVVGRPHIPETRDAVQDYFRTARGNDNSWLQPENYRIIRQLVQRGRIATATLDLRDTERFSALQQEWGKQGYRLGYAYISSVLTMLSPLFRKDYHGKSRPPQQQDDNDLHTIRTNLLSIGDEHSRVLPVVAPSMEEGHKLQSVNPSGLQDLCDRLSSNSGDYNREMFGIGKASYWILSGEPQYFPDYTRMPSMQPSDKMISLSKSEAFNTSEAAALNRLLHSYALNYAWLAKKEASPHMLTIHIPAERLESGSGLLQHITDELQSALRTTAKTSHTTGPG